jgi:hypothetical protein
LGGECVPTARRARALDAAAGAGGGALIGLGVSDEEAAYYDAEFRRGRTILVVDPDQRGQLVQTLYAAHNAQSRQVMTSGTLADQIAARQI